MSAKKHSTCRKGRDTQELKAQRRARLKIESLEPRLLFSADLPAWHVDLDMVATHADQYTQLISNDSHAANESILPAVSATTIVVIDVATPDYQQLVDDIKQQNGSVAVYLLNAETDGLEQISNILAKHSNVESLQIISHGQSGQLELGGTSIDTSTLLSRAGDISQWRDSFAANADILIYGCELAGSESGEQFVQVLGYLTSTDVAASDDKTGSTTQGANWNLEYNTGSIESELALSKQVQNDYSGVLLTITVTTTSDHLNSGIAANNSAHNIAWLKANFSGSISLREAIIAANNDETTTDPITIILDSGSYLIEIVGTNENNSIANDFDIKGNITIEGKGAHGGATGTTIIGNSISRIFDIQYNGILNLSDVRLTNGNSGTENGGAIRTNNVTAQVHLTRVDISGNSGADGGGIYNTSSNFTLTDVTITQNTGDRGGGLFTSAPVNLNRVTVSFNQSNEEGGGIFAQTSSGVVVINSTISNNVSLTSGGGMRINGGTLTNVTIANNHADLSGGLTSANPVVAQNIISTGNTSSNVDDADFNAPVTSRGGNVIHKTTTAFAGTDDIVGTAAQLDVLQDNGGETETHALLAGSAGIDNGVLGTASNAPALDQRDYTREGRLDSGSYEYNGTSSVVQPLVVTTQTDHLNSGIVVGNPVHTVDWLRANFVGTLSLREAIVAANNTSGLTIIALDGLTYDLSSGSGEEDESLTNDLDIKANIVIEGTDIELTRINGNSLSRVFEVHSGGTLQLSNLTVTGGDAGVSPGGGIRVQSGGRLITDTVEISGNTTNGDGGGIANVGSGIIELLDTTITANSGASGGGLYNTADATLNRVTVNNNNGGQQGAGIYSQGASNFVLTNSTVSGNTTPNTGGGLYISNGLIINTTITGNVGNTAGGISASSPMTLFNVISAGNINSGGANTDADFRGGSTVTGTGNVIENSSNAAFSLAGNSVGVAPLLSALQDNGGKTLTHALLAGSVGIDFGVNHPNNPITDQRGSAREGASLDSGSVEYIAFANNAPTLDTPAQFSIIENHAGALPVTVTDADGHSLAYRLTGTDDDALFNIDGISGAITFNTPPDFENPTDADGNNIYVITLEADDGNGEVLTQTLEITVTDANYQLVVTTLADNVDGVVRSVQELIENQGTDGAISLREAITAANMGNDPVSISFDISEPMIGGEHRIAISTELPPIKNSIIIDGTTDSDYTNTPVIVLDGALSIDANGLQLNGADNSEIRGLKIVNFDETAIALSNCDTVLIAGNYLGTNGTTAEGNAVGVHLSDCTAVTIGGDTVADRNIISGNSARGVLVSDDVGMNNIIKGNYIGTDATGTLAVANDEGITLWGGTSNHTIGGINPGEGNVISGNTKDGIKITDLNTGLTAIQGNYIGVDKTGLLDLGNGGNGIHIKEGATGNTIGGSSSAERNIISGNGASGITLNSTSDNVVAGNFIGTNLSGTTAIANGVNGVTIENGAANNIIGGTALLAIGNPDTPRNIISGNGEAGVAVNDATTNNNTIARNYIGTDINGTSALANVISGVSITSAVFTTIGGTAADTGNVISGNGNYGIHLTGTVIQAASNTTIQSNKIGTDATGSLAVANTGVGIYLLNHVTDTTIGGVPDIVGGTQDGGRNTISANTGHGVMMTGENVSNNTVIGNIAGLTSDGTAALGNGGHGFVLGNGADNNKIGGSNVASSTTPEGNIASGNGLSGINLYGSTTTNNIVQGNLVGTDHTGYIGIGNTRDGIYISNGANDNMIGGGFDFRNVIADSGESGIQITGKNTDNNKILGNFIGTDADGTGAINNAAEGIYIMSGASFNQIGNGIAAEANVISGNVDGVVIEDANNNSILGNNIGVGSDGLTVIGNTGNGILIKQSSTNTNIGNGTLAGANVIGGSGLNGINMTGVTTSLNHIDTNYIGISKTGSNNIFNSSNGILINAGANNSKIDGNIIANNVGYGILLSDAGTDYNTVRGNHIGTDEAGLIAYGNQEGGIFVNDGSSYNTIGGDSTLGEGNVISGNGGPGVYIYWLTSNFNTISGNLIGTNATGNLPLPNLEQGIVIIDAPDNTIGGNTAGLRNIISGNTWAGIAVWGSGGTGNTIVGNYIGTNKAGDAAVPNTNKGIHIVNTSNVTIGGPAVLSNLISGNTEQGIGITDSTAVTIQGNLIGTDALGLTDLKNTLGGIAIAGTSSAITIGAGSADPAAAGNVISGNGADGISVAATAENNLIAGNTIGLTLGGLGALGNMGNGVVINGANNTIGGTNAAQRNYIGANAANGVLLAATANNSRVVNSHIGIASNGSLMANAVDGIRVESNNNAIGGTTAASANTVAYNAANAVTVLGQENAVLGNILYNNLLPIDLGNNSSTPNDPDNLDADLGANALQNNPTITQAASLVAGSVQVIGELDSAANTRYRIEIFGDSKAPVAGYGDAEVFLGAFTVTTDGAGKAPLNETFTGLASIGTGDHVSATATEIVTPGVFSNTSELSQATLIRTQFVPETTGIPDLTVNEDDTGISVLLTDYYSDVEDTSTGLTYTIESVSNPAILDGPSISAGVLSLPLMLNANGTTDITIGATDSNANRTETLFTLTVTPDNDAPTITSGSNFLFNENTTSVTTITSTDVDGGVPSYSLALGGDAAEFTLDAATGELSFNTAPDAENPTDIGTDNIYQLTVQVRDGIDTTSQAITVTVLDVDEGPVGPIIDTDASANELLESATAGTSAGIVAAASDPDISDNVEYSLDPGSSSLFNIDQNTGEVRLATGAVLDAETATSHSITVRATSDDNSSSTQDFSINVIDVNDNVPVVAPGQTFNLDENNVAGHLVGTVVGSDADVTEVLQNWTIESGNAAGIFAINANTGEITIANASNLDYETATAHSLGISVSDGTKVSVTEYVEINVIDFNEKPIIDTVASTSINEGSSYSQVIQVTDPEGAAIQIQAFTLPAWLTLTDNNNGTATLTGTPTETEVGPHNVTISATDGVNSADSISFTITVIDVEHPPTLNFALSHTIDEPTTVVGTVVGADLDNDALTYSLAPGDDSAQFTISPTGVLSFIAATDAENPTDTGTNNIYNLTVQVSDGNTTTSQAITVEVLDVNETPISVITDSNNSANTVSEGFTWLGQPVGITASAFDSDLSDNVTYSLDSNGGSHFTINSTTGVITTRSFRTIDAETSASYDVVVRATSSDNSFETRTFTINIGDVNDNTPTISFGQSFNVNEDATAPLSLGTVIGNDADITGVLQGWAISSGNTDNTFAIDSATGELSLVNASNLDHETDPSRLLMVTVSDGSRTSIATGITVNILNVNENPTITPILNPSTPEGSLFSQVIEATDPEGDAVTITATQLPAWATLTQTGVSTYQISGTPTPADLGANLVELSASDPAGLVSDPYSFTINVTDVEYAPTITFANKHIVNEPDQLVGTVVGADLDNDVLSYSLGNSGDGAMFTIDAASGVLSFTAASDADILSDNNKDNTYEITVQVSDGTTTTSKAVTVELAEVDEFAASAISDSNNNPNQVAENAGLGATVGLTASAFDGDLSDGITYSLDPSSGSIFTINPTSGLVTVAADNLLDRETATSHTITVIATSDDNTSSTANFTIAVTDVNDTPPAVTTGQLFAVSEAANVATSVGTVTATDVDITGSLGSWRIDSGNAVGVFQIDSSTGEISVLDSASLDFETTPSYSLGISVSDGINRSATEIVTIDVLDANEKPSFIPVNNPSVNEGDVFTQLIATTDPENDAVLISATQLPSWLSLTDNGNGTGTLSGTPDSASAGTYDVVLNANDGNLSATPLAFTITVNKVNDLPVIIFPTTVTIDENTQAVGVVNSTDIDNDVVTYSLANTGDAAFFSIDSATGALSFSVAPDADIPADGDTNNIYDITVLASDGASPVSQDVAITVTNLDESDVGLISDIDLAANSIDENAAPNSTVGITAQASDTDSNDTVSYAIVDASGLLTIDAGTGVVSTNAALDYESRTSITFDVVATSTDGSTSTQAYTININDVNDNAPVVTSNQSFIASENLTSGSLIGAVAATDVDTGAVLQNWQIVGGNANNIIEIDATTGELSLAGGASLDYETTPQYTLSVVVSDEGGNMSAATDVVVNISDINEAPVITSASNATAIENTPFNFTVLASDQENNALTVSTSSALPAWLALDQSTGELSGTPAHADVGTYVLTFLVDDGLNTSSQVFTLSVTDINQAPSITSVAPATATEDASFSHLITSSDPDNDSVSFSSANLPAWLTLTDNSNGTATLQGIPTNADVGINSFTLEVNDGALSQSQQVDIDVINTNDLPVLTLPSAVAVDENTTVVVTAASTDDDNTPPVYSLANGGDNELFSINPTTGELTFSTAPDAENALDTDANNTYNITVQVSDGSPTLVSQNLVVSVRDVNEFDISPIVDINTSVNSVAENAFPGALTGVSANATDTDLNDSVSYELTQNANGLFTINRLTGEISVSPNASIDYEQSQSHELEILATSSDGTTSLQVMTIAVNDVNDNAPVIAPAQSFEVRENAASGVSLTTLVATDSDSVGSLQNWAIVGGNAAGIFTINPVTGEITTSNTTTLDFEQTQQHTLQVQVSDGVQSATQTVNARVVNVNEAPSISAIQHSSVAGYTGSIGSLNVTDPDTSAITSYEIVGGTGQASFAFGQGDQIVQTQGLSPGAYTLDVIVTDAGGLSAEATININVIASDGIPQIGASELDNLTGAITNTTPTTTTSAEPEPESMPSTEASEPEPETTTQTLTSEEAVAEENTIIGSAANSTEALFIVDSRFVGSQAANESQLHIRDNNEHTRQTTGGKSLVSTTSLAMEVLIQDTESLMKNFDLELDSLNISTTLTPALLNAISDMSSDVNNASQKDEIQLELAIKAGTVVSVTLTVGFITWLMQTGAFLTTALSTAPLWRSLDPIPVLMSSDEDDDDMEQFDD